MACQAAGASRFGHFTPTGASWMNQIEIWNGIITRKVIRCARSAP